MNRFWIVRAGEKGFLFDKFDKKNLVAIGWNELGDLSAINNREEIKKALSKIYGATGVANGLHAGIIYKFIKEFKKGDGVITYDPLNRIYKVGKVEGNYEYNEDLVEYFHTRQINWKNSIKRDDLTQSTKNAHGSVLTIFELKGKERNELEAFLSPKIDLLDKRLIHKEIKKRKENLFDNFEGKCAFCKMPSHS